MKGFHGTSAVPERLERLREVSGGRHPNCYMGLWVAFDLELASRFGASVLEVEVPEPAVYDMEISELSSLANQASRSDDEIAVHIAFADQLRAQGFNVARIVESDGRSDMAILLRPEECVIGAVHETASTSLKF